MNFKKGSGKKYWLYAFPINTIVRRRKLLELSKINLQGVEIIFLLAEQINPIQVQAMETLWGLGVKKITTVPCPEEIKKIFLKSRQMPPHEQTLVKFVKIDDNTNTLTEMFGKAKKSKR